MSSITKPPNTLRFTPGETVRFPADLFAARPVERAQEKEFTMLLRLATFGALGYAAYKYYENNREQVDGMLRQFTSSGDGDADQGGQHVRAEQADGIELAGGPLSEDAQVVPAGSGGPV
jgi:hypothetical protein